ncbi:molybdopterin synthase sulfur carrier subunit [Haloferax sp. MBLA0076]|uniref:Molybdopterin synthase sulfur carrier subunit n=1 Tax=Haloferax litoreum TaxID=2666140 RepID=A0A6A8GKB3_9EURY|nr:MULTISPECIES: ubiquitin-like small modifier protein 1 [Haloferax]KAB1190559.1 MoaD/ThiS family protein [Haloferax sp. CBA1148]MRX23545.1 molybdopterin synthase sulfur carrier subunit [Haloferax litoreum]
MVTVTLYGPVRDAVGEKRLSAEGETVGDVLETLTSDYPTVGERVLADGEVRGQVQIFVDGRKIGPLGGLETPLDGVDTVQITEAMSGG